MKPKLLIGVLLLAVIVGAASPAFSQCAMCRENAAAAGEGAEALNFGIIVLLMPALVMFMGVLVFAAGRRDALLVKESAPNGNGARPAPEIRG